MSDISWKSILPIVGGIAGTFVAPGLGTALGAGLGAVLGDAFPSNNNTQPGMTGSDQGKPTIPAPMERQRYKPPTGYVPGVNPEHTYFSRFDQGGLVVPQHQLQPVNAADYAGPGPGLANWSQIAASVATPNLPPPRPHVPSPQAVAFDPLTYGRGSSTVPGVGPEVVNQPPQTPAPPTQPQAQPQTMPQNPGDELQWLLNQQMMNPTDAQIGARLHKLQMQLGTGGFYNRFGGPGSMGGDAGYAGAYGAFGDFSAGPGGGYSGQGLGDAGGLGFSDVSGADRGSVYAGGGIVGYAEGGKVEDDSPSFMRRNFDVEDIASQLVLGKRAKPDKGRIQTQLRDAYDASRGHFFGTTTRALPPSMIDGPKYAEGGMVDPQGDVSLLEETKAALQGRHPQAEEVINRFIEVFGLPALQRLRMQNHQEVQGKISVDPSLGMLSQDGMSDSVPAMINGRQPAKLSEGEFVVPADAVSALGNGSTQAGARRMDAMVKSIRTQAHGKPGQQAKVNAGIAMGIQ